MLNCKISKWYFYRRFGIPKDKEIFKLQKTSIHYWKDKEKGIAQCREYGRNLFDIPNWLKHLFHLWDTHIAQRFCPFLDLGYATDTSSTNNKDVWLYSVQPDTNKSAQAYMLTRYGEDAGSSWIMRSLIHFTLSSGSGTITKVELYAYCDYDYGDATIEAHQLTQTGWVENQATWNSYKTGSAWVNPGGDFSATVIDTFAHTDVDVWENWVLMGTGAENPLTLDWENEVHILLKKDTETGTAVDLGAQYQTKEGANVPYILITYTPATKARSFGIIV